MWGGGGGTLDASINYKQDTWDPWAQDHSPPNRWYWHVCDLFIEPHFKEIRFSTYFKVTASKHGLVFFPSCSSARTGAAYQVGRN